MENQIQSLRGAIKRQERLLECIVPDAEDKARLTQLRQGLEILEARKAALVERFTKRDNWDQSRADAAADAVMALDKALGEHEATLGSCGCCGGAWLTVTVDGEEADVSGLQGLLEHGE